MFRQLLHGSSHQAGQTMLHCSTSRLDTFKSKATRHHNTTKGCVIQSDQKTYPVRCQLLWVVFASSVRIQSLRRFTLRQHPTALDRECIILRSSAQVCYAAMQLYRLLCSKHLQSHAVVWFIAHGDQNQPLMSITHKTELQSF